MSTFQRFLLGHLNENCFDVVAVVVVVTVVDVVAVACVKFLHDLLFDFSKSFLAAIFDFDSGFSILYCVNLKKHLRLRFPRSILYLVTFSDV